MDTLHSGDRLPLGQELASANGWVRVLLNSAGLVVYRTQTRATLWTSPASPKRYAALVMQGHGNLVAFAGDGSVIWSSGTNGHAGASAVLQDDGNFVIYDPGGTALWASNTVVNFATPTIGYSDSRGYSYVETSEQWQLMCRALPCFDALRWPGYDAIAIDAVINNEPVVIQLWKGWCQKFLGLQFFPGGIGGEVGVYRRIPGKLKPTSFPGLPVPLATTLLTQLAVVADKDLWWPAPDLNAQLEFSFINPITHQPVFTAGPENSYWLCKWMNEPSYIKYMADQGLGRFPGDPTAYILEYKVNGIVGRWPSDGASSTVGRSPISAVVRSADTLDVFTVDSTSTVRTASWAPGNTDGWHGPSSLPARLTPPGGAVCAVSRSADHLDVFAAGADGVVRTAAWEPGFADGWHGWWVILDGRTVPGGAVTAVSRRPDYLDVFVVGLDSHVYTAAWSPTAAGGWGGWWRIGDATAPPGSAVTVVSRSLDHLDIFVTDIGGRVLTAAWEPAFADGWHGWWEVSSGRAAAGAAVTAVSRAPDVMDVFVVGTDARIWQGGWAPTTGWRGWSQVLDAVLPPKAAVTAVSRSLNHLDLFVTDASGAVRTAAWEPGFADGWHGWQALQGGRAAPGATVSAAVRSADHLDVFVIGTDGHTYSAAWEPAFADGWHGWWRIPAA